MQFIKLSAITITISLFLMACNSSQPDETVDLNVNPEDGTEIVTEADDDYWARDNFDLQRVGEVLEEADNAEELEYLINRDDGINNLDLNGDGYVDYISVAEYEDRDTGARGFSLFDRFGVDDIQEIATIIFDRDRPDQRGARIYLDGNDQIYGDDYFYERNWLDKSLDIANYIFSDRRDDNYYESPYYYDNYPDNYTTYRVVETPVYRTRVTRLYPEPVFVKTQVNPAMTKIKIKSPYHGKSIDKIYAKFAKPTKEQKEFIKNKPEKPKFDKIKDDKFKEKNDISEKDFDKLGKDKKDKPAKDNKPEKLKEKKDKPGKLERNDSGKKESKKADKDDNGGKSKGGGKDKGKDKGKP